MPGRYWPAWLMLAMIAPSAALAQTAPAAPPAPADGFTLSGSVRLRYETIDGQARAGFNDSDELLSLRTMIQAEYRVSRWTLVAQVHDARSWLARRGTPLTTGEVNALELVQAHVIRDLGPVFGAGSKATVQAGRFRMALGSRRLIADDDYRNTTNGFTGVRADLTTARGVQATAYYTLPQTRLPDDFEGLRQARVRWDRESFDQVLWGGIVTAPWRKGSRHKADAAFVHLGERDAPGRPTRDRSLNSVTARVFADPAPGRTDYEAEGIYQWGRTGTSLAANAARVPVSAAFFHLRAGYTFAAGWQPRVSFEFDYAGGDQAGNTFSRFDPIFGMRRADLGPAGLYNEIGRTNLVSPGVRLEVTPGKRTDAFVTYKPMWLASRSDSFSTTGVRDPGGASGSFAGHQIDARVRYWLLPGRLRLEADGVLLLKGRFLTRAPNAPRGGDTRYLSLNAMAMF